MTYQVSLEVFEGPFDLLLHLIAKRQVDVMVVDLADITADFLASLDGIGEVDLETATRFLVVAATLIEIKAARLLPADERDELEDILSDARDLLYARLLEYRAFREAAAVIRDGYSAGSAFHPRDVALEPWLQRLVPQADLHVRVEDLARLAALATMPRVPEVVDLSHLRRSTLSIREAAAEVLDRLPATNDLTTFRAIVEGRGRAERVVLFLAMLELYKLGQVELDQPDHRGSLTVRRRRVGGDLSAIIDLADLTSADEDKLTLVLTGDGDDD